MLRIFPKLLTNNIPNNVFVATCSGTCASGQPKKIAVVLSGCGVFDGTEIHEAAAVCNHITKEGGEVFFYAPDKKQCPTINHLKGEPDEADKRNVLVESARIARGCVFPLTTLNTKCVDAVIFPGGFGVAKNLSDFAEKGPDCTVDKEVERVLRDFCTHKKPIGMCCIAPILAAKVFGQVTITLGRKGSKGDKKWPHADAIEAAKKMGAKIEEKDVNQISVDKEVNLVTTPAFMYEGKFCEVSDGIGMMVKEVIKLIK